MRSSSFFLLGCLFVLAGCANQTTPTGGKRDVTAPRLLTITPADSLRNTRVKKIELTFDEYITVNDAVKEVQISPILTIQPAAMGNSKKVTVKIVDSLLEDNTTYRITFGTAIKDLHEGNPFPNYTYTFSTGAYFDSLVLAGSILNAATGLPDTSGTSVILYNATESDSAVVRHKPKYVAKADGTGHFIFKGLPKKSFKIYALKDADDNLYYNKGADMIAFHEEPVIPMDSARTPVLLRLFQEESDTASQIPDLKSARKGIRGEGNEAATGELTAIDPSAPITYTVGVDTSATTKRTFDITKQLKITFSRMPLLNKEKITLLYDSSGVAIVQDVAITRDTSSPNMLSLTTKWKENTLYTLKLAKGFAKDSSGGDVVPSKYTFRTKEDEDYGKITIRLPSKYYGNSYVLQVIADKDTIYQKPVNDTVVALSKLAPTKYSFRVIADKNGNGKWDTGDLLLKRQPEEVFPYPAGILFLKPGWENVLDFDKNPKERL